MSASTAHECVRSLRHFQCTVGAMSLPLPAEEPFSESFDDLPDAADIVDIVDRPTLRASGPAEIVQLVPYLLGFHPSESLVLLALRGRRIVVSVRYDLGAPLEMLQPWCQAAMKAGADRVVSLIYAEGIDGSPLPHRELSEQLRDLFESHALDEVDAIAVSDGRWWSYRCGDARCCPAEGTPIDANGAVAASAVTEGMVALPSRESLESELEVDEMAADRVLTEMVTLMAAELEGPEPNERVGRAEDWAQVRAFVRGARKGADVTYEQAARVLCALSDRSVRDAAIGYLVGRPEPEVQEGWRQLTRMAPEERRAAPATLYAMWCYASGSGARTNVGIDVALAADPNYAMALILLDLQSAGINPFEFIHEMALEAKLIGRRIQRKRDPSGRRHR